jgi:NADPH-dependent ferric siderophore reductase
MADTTERPAAQGRAPRQAHRAIVRRTERLTPGMVRVVLGGLPAGFAADTCTDHYIKLLFPPPGVRYPEPFDLGRIREELPREQWPVTRTYTVRSFDPHSDEMAVDFVVHGDSGLAGPWADGARPGDAIAFLGPGGGYAPDPHAGWHLLAGDAAALPAIAASLEAMPEDATVHAFIEVAGPEEEQKLTAPPDAHVTWLHTGAARVGEALVAAVRGLDAPPGEVQAFVHGEAGWVKELRRHLRAERAIPRERLSISGYWRLGLDEDGWQASKREWNAQVEAEQEAGVAATAT